MRGRVGGAPPARARRPLWVVGGWRAPRPDCPSVCRRCHAPCYPTESRPRCRFVKPLPPSSLCHTRRRSRSHADTVPGANRYPARARVALSAAGNLPMRTAAQSMPPSPFAPPCRNTSPFDPPSSPPVALRPHPILHKPPCLRPRQRYRAVPPPEPPPPHLRRLRLFLPCCPPPAPPLGGPTKRHEPRLALDKGKPRPPHERSSRGRQARLARPPMTPRRPPSSKRAFLPVPSLAHTPGQLAARGLPQLQLGRLRQLDLGPLGAFPICGDSLRCPQWRLCHTCPPGQV